jgi:uncharacterized protein with PIN domain
MNIVDSSGWLAYFADEPNGKHFQLRLENSWVDFIGEGGV